MLSSQPTVLVNIDALNRSKQPLSLSLRLKISEALHIHVSKYKVWSVLTVGVNFVLVAIKVL